VSGRPFPPPSASSIDTVADHSINANMVENSLVDRIFSSQERVTWSVRASLFLGDVFRELVARGELVVLEQEPLRAGGATSTLHVFTKGEGGK